MKIKKNTIRVIAIILLMLLLLSVCVLFAGCAAAEEAELVSGSAKETSEYAILSLPNGEIIEGYVQRKYISSSGCVHITVNDTEYLTHMSNVVVFDK